MASRIFTSSRTDNWNSPRPYRDASLRFAMHGAVQPMHQPTWLDRLLRRY